MARARPCTQSVHGRGRPYTWAASRLCTEYTTVYTVVYLYTAVFTARVQGRPCTCDVPLMLLAPNTRRVFR